MGPIGKYSAGKILRADGERPEAAAGRDRLVESVVESSRRGIGGTTTGDMSLVAYFRSVSARFFRRAKIDNELETELTAHIQLHADRLERSGLDRAAAERRARIEFGSTERFKEECREQLGGNFLDTLLQDVRFSLRTLRKSPAFFLVAVITLALGIGATVAAFSVVNSVLLRPFGFSNSDKLLWLYSQRSDNPRTNFSLPEYCDYRDQTTSFDGLAAIASFNPSLSDSGEPERVQGV